MDSIAVEAALRRMGLQVTAAEAIAVGNDLKRIAAGMQSVVRTWADASVVASFEDVLARFGRRRSDGTQTPQPAIPFPFAPERVSSVQRSTNAFIEIFDTAAALHTPHAPADDGNLRGLPFAYKDVFVAPGRLPTCGGGTGYRWQGPESTVLARLRTSGAIAVGATNLDPHCYMAIGLNRDFGRVLNPHGPTFSVGGSSSRSAVAVAVGVVPFALGSDTGGSVRIPASLCGIYGLKPSHGLIVDPGLAPLSPSQDTAGLLAADIACLERVFHVLAGRKACGGETIPTIGVDLGNLCEGVDPDIGACFDSALGRAAGLGCQVLGIDFPDVASLNLLASVVTSYEAARIHAAGISKRPEHYPAGVRRRLLTALLVGRAPYDQAIALRPVLARHVLEAVFGRVDMVLCPTLRKRAVRVDGLSEDDDNIAGAVSLEHLRLTRPINYLGLPALSVPIGRDQNGIPVGVQLIGRPNGEEELFALAKHLNRH